MVQDVWVKPYSTVTSGGITVPLFLLTYDKAGNCTSPAALRSVIDGARNGTFDHIHVFAHGWNTLFDGAEHLCEGFYHKYVENRSRTARACTPLEQTAFVGVVWPSTLLVAPSEAAPQIAAVATPDAADAHVLERDAQVLAEELPPELQREFRDLLADRTGSQSARRIAQLLAPIFARAHDEAEPADRDVTVEEILRVAQAAAAQLGSRGAAAQRDDAPRYADEEEDDLQPSAAAWSLSDLDPRWIVRLASVLQMKDRAGTVGAGVGRSLIAPLLSSSESHVYGVGHSYGTKVMLSSICAGAVTRPIDSLLLLEPAISRFAFAARVGGGRSGGYRPALERVVAPIFSTWSRRDWPLHVFYGLAVRRAADIGEQKIAGLFDRSAALGGYGAAGLEPGEGLVMPISTPGDAYPRDRAARLYSLDGSNDRIRSHGDVVSDYTGWAHVVLVDGVWQP